MGTLCGGTQQAAPGMGDDKVTVHGDILLPDVRSALTILKICEIKFNHEGTQALEKAKTAKVDPQGVDVQMLLSEHTPIVEVNRMKHVGSAHEVLMECCMKDQRNMPKKDEQGRVIKQQKKGPKALSLYPSDFQKQIQQLLEWYLAKLKPHALHLYKKVTEALEFESSNTYDESGKNGDEKVKKSTKDMDTMADNIMTTMRHVHAAFEAFNNHLKSLGDNPIQRTGYAVCSQFTLMDIIMYNEINQILHVYEAFVNKSVTSQCIKTRKECPNQNYSASFELFNYTTLKKWYENTTKLEEGKTIAQFSTQFKNKFEEKLKDLKDTSLAAKSVQNEDFKAKLGSLIAAGPPGAGFKY